MMKEKHISLLFLVWTASILCPTLSAQGLSLKTNLLGWGTTTPNVGIEAAIDHRHTLHLAGALNPWDFSGDRHVHFWAVQPEWRHWFCEKFNGHFIGIHALGGEYNIKNVDMPFKLLPHTEKGRHYEGWYIGAGITYGYQWMLSHHWNLEAAIGIGYAYSPYKLYGRCDRCLDRSHRHYVGPTKAAVSLCYVF